MMLEAGRDLLAVDLDAGPYAVPDRLDRTVGQRKLETLGVRIDEPTDSQRTDRQDWQEGF